MKKFILLLLAALSLNSVADNLGGPVYPYGGSSGSGGSATNAVNFVTQNNASTNVFTTVITNSTNLVVNVATNTAPNTVYAGPSSGGNAAATFQTTPTVSGANLTALPTNTTLYPTLNQNSTGTSYPTSLQAETLTYYKNILANGSDISAYDLSCIDRFVVKSKFHGTWPLYTEVDPLAGKDYLAALTKLKWDNSGTSYAKNYLNFTNASPTANDTATIGATTYTFVAGSPASGQYQVTISATSNTLNSIVNLVNCINNSGGTAGTDYSSGGSANASVTSKYTYNSQPSYYECDVRAIAPGATGSAVTVSKSCSIAQWANASTTLIFGIDSAYLQLVNISAGSPFQSTWYDSNRGFTFPNTSHNSQGNFITSNYDPSTNSSTVNQGNNCLGAAFTSEQAGAVLGYDDAPTGVEKWYVNNTDMGNFNLAAQIFANGNGVFSENQTTTAVTYVNTGMPLTVGTGSYTTTALNPGTLLINRIPNTAVSNAGYSSGSGTSYGFVFTGQGMTSTLMAQQASADIDELLVSLGRLSPMSKRILNLGDSTTQGTSGTGEAIYTRVLANSLNLNSINAGVPAESFLNSSAPNTRLLDLFNLSLVPDVLTLQEGINDQRTDGATVSQWGSPTRVTSYTTGMSTFIGDCVQYSWPNGTELSFRNNPKLYIISPFWTYFDNSNTTHGGNTTAGSAQGQAYTNGRLEQYSAAGIAANVYGPTTQGGNTGQSLVKYIDCYHLFEDAPNNYINGTSYFAGGSPFSGGLHPNSAGYTLIGNYVASVVKGNVVGSRKLLVTFPSNVATSGATTVGQVVSFTGGSPYVPALVPGTYAQTGVSGITATTANSSTTLSVLSSATGLLPGQGITGTGIPAGTVLVSVNAGALTAVMSQAATATNTLVNLAFTGTLTNSIYIPGAQMGQSVTLGLPPVGQISLSSITSSGNSTQDVFTVTGNTNTGLTEGMSINMASMSTDTNANGYWYITGIATGSGNTTFSFRDAAYAVMKGGGSAGSGGVLLEGVPDNLNWTGRVVQSDNGTVPGIVNISCYNATGGNITVNPIYISVTVRN